MTEFKLTLRDAKDRPATVQEHRALIEVIERMRKKINTVRNYTIEECAQRADAYLSNIGLKGKGRDVAAAIRALKDKP